MQSVFDRRFRVGLVALAALSFAAIVLSAWAIYAYHQADDRIWHAVICHIEHATLKQHLPADRERTVLRFYDRLLVHDVRTAGCGLLQGRTP